MLHKITYPQEKEGQNLYDAKFKSQVMMIYYKDPLLYLYEKDDI